MIAQNLPGIVDMIEVTPDSITSYFVVDISAQYVPVVDSVNKPIMKNAAVQVGVHGKEFTTGDNLSILSYGLRIPYCFHLASGNPFLKLSWENAIGTIMLPMAEISPLSPPTTITQLFLPLADREINLNIFVRQPFTGGSAGVSSGHIICGIGGALIDMAGVPAAFNGQTIMVYPFMKVQHTLPMTT